MCELLADIQRGEEAIIAREFLMNVRREEEFIIVSPRWPDGGIDTTYDLVRHYGAGGRLYDMRGAVGRAQGLGVTRTFAQNLKELRPN